MSREGSKVDSKTPSDVLDKKKGHPLEKPPTILRTIVQRQQDEYKEPKPFQKKYGSNTPNRQTNKDEVRLSMDKTYTSKKISAVSDHQGSTKQTFNQRLQNNIIKDEEEISQKAPSSRNSFRIKKVDNRSPKKVRDDLFVLNEQQYKMQKEIMEFHKRNLGVINQTVKNYKIPSNIEKWLEKPEQNAQSTSSLSNDAIIKQLNYQLKTKEKQLSKCEKKVTENAYVRFFQSLPETNIDQLSESEEEDIVQELPPEKPRLDAASGSYSSNMTGMKNKSYSLNQRRTFDVFKEPGKEKASRVTTNQQEGPKVNSEIILDKEENRVTLNNKFKDFLLN